jgi:hypothetical protein
LERVGVFSGFFLGFFFASFFASFFEGLGGCNEIQILGCRCLFFIDSLLNKPRLWSGIFALLGWRWVVSVLKELAQTGQVGSKTAKIGGRLDGEPYGIGHKRKLHPIQRDIVR